MAKKNSIDYKVGDRVQLVVDTRYTGQVVGHGSIDEGQGWRHVVLMRLNVPIIDSTGRSARIIPVHPDNLREAPCPTCGK